MNNDTKLRCSDCERVRQEIPRGECEYCSAQAVNLCADSQGYVPVCRDCGGYDSIPFCGRRDHGRGKVIA